MNNKLINQNNNCICVIKSHNKSVRCVQFSSNNNNNNSNLLISSSDDKTCKLWDINKIGNNNNNKLQSQFKCSLIGHKNWVRSCCFGYNNNNNNLIVTGSDDKTIKLWDVRIKSHCIKTIYDHSDVVSCVRFSENNNNLIGSCSFDGSIKLYDIRNMNKMIQNYQNNKTRINKIDFYKSFLISCGNDKLIKIYDILEGHQLYSISSHKTNINSM